MSYKQVNVRKENLKKLLGFTHLPQVHKKCAMKEKNDKEKQCMCKTVGRKHFIRPIEKTGENAFYELCDLDKNISQ